MVQKEPYFITQIDAQLFIVPGYYLGFMPVWVPYGKIGQRAKSQGLEIDGQFGILEKSVAFGRGWIGVKVKSATTPAPNSISIQGEFTTFEHLGSYRNLGMVFKQIMRDFPKASDFYSLYLNDPGEVAEKDLKTWILFRA